MNNYFKTCSICGANLDPTESCDCETIKNKNVRQVSRAAQTKQTTRKSNGNNALAS